MEWGKSSHNKIETEFIIIIIVMLVTESNTIPENNGDAKDASMVSYCFIHLEQEQKMKIMS